MAQTLTDHRIVASIKGNVTGQVACGEHIEQKMLTISSLYGDVINLELPERHIDVRPRTIPITLLPRRFPGLLDRHLEIEAAVSSMQLVTPIEFYGQNGWGKTSLLDHLAFVQAASTFSDGIAWRRIHGWTVSDVLQWLYDAFFECDTPFKPSAAEIQRALQAKHALVLLDDVDLTRDEMAELTDAVPGCVVVLASTERHLWGEGVARSLTGLPPDDALALIERELGRPLIPEERPAAQTLCSTLAGHPLHLIQAAALVREDGRSVADVARYVQTAAPDEIWGAAVVTGLSATQRRALLAVAAVPAVSLSAEPIAAMTGISDIVPTIDALLRRGLALEEHHRYRLAGALREPLQRAWDLTPWAEALLAYFTRWADERKNNPSQLQEELDSILGVLQWAATAAHWAEIVHLGRTVESALTLSGRWGAWAQVLRWILQAAQALGDAATEAWALHQLGTRALCLGDFSTARESLNRALIIRESMSDRIGSAVTRHNLNLLPPIPTPAQLNPRRLDTWPHDEVLRHVLRHVALILIPALLVVLGIGVWWLSAHGNAGASSATGINPQSLDFGAQQVGRSSPEHIVTVTNNGTGDLVVRGIALDGANPADFHITSDTCTGRHLASAKSCTVHVNFAPSATGGRTAILKVTSNASDSPRDLSLSGAGVGVSVLRLNPSRLDFGSVALGQRLVKSIRLTNSGAGNLTATSVILAGVAASDFRLGNSCSASIAPGKGCAISVSFAPTAAGARTATLVITDNAVGSPQRVALSGVGVKMPGIWMSATSLSFGSVTVGVTSQSQIITLTNTGTSDLMVSQILLGPASSSDPSFADFKVGADTCTGHPVAQDNSCTISVSFTPSALGNRAAALTITDNAAGSPRNVVLGGVGIPVQLVGIVVKPDKASVYCCYTHQQFTATGIYSDNSQQPLTTSVIWRSDPYTVASITNHNSDSSGGLATSLTQGTTTITATLDGVSGQAILTVTPPIIKAIVVTPTNPCIQTGGQQQFMAMGSMSNGTSLDLTHSVTWSSSNPHAATITPTGGQATAESTSATASCPSPTPSDAIVNPSDVTVITATSGPVSGSATLTVVYVVP